MGPSLVSTVGLCQYLLSIRWRYQAMYLFIALLLVGFFLKYGLFCQNIVLRRFLSIVLV